MKKVLTTFAVGELHEAMLNVTLPSMARYARDNDYCLYIPDFGEIYQDYCGRFASPSWAKIGTILRLFLRFEFVLWLDADVLPQQFDRDIADDCTAPLSMVVHRTSDGEVPNCGVLAVRRCAEAKNLLDETLRHGARWQRSEHWWEQAEIIAQLGGNPDAERVAVPPGDLWRELPYTWNPHPCDDRGVDGTRFFHCTQYEDRVGTLKKRARC